MSYYMSRSQMECDTCDPDGFPFAIAHEYVTILDGKTGKRSKTFAPLPSAVAFAHITKGEYTNEDHATFCLRKFYGTIWKDPGKW